MANQTSEVLRVHQLGEMLSFDQVASVLCVSRRTLDRLVHSKVLVPVSVSTRRPRFPIEAVAEFRLRGLRRPALVGGGSS